jgi:predicted DNA binding protein
MDFDFSDRPLDPEQIIANAETEELTEDVDYSVSPGGDEETVVEPSESIEKIRAEYEAVESLIDMGYVVDENEKSLVDEEEEIKQKALKLGYDEKDL